MDFRTLFKPKYASAESPVPLVVSCHGYLNNSKMQDINAIELSRRGVAVITYDAYFHGKSSSSNADIMTSTMTDGIGMVSVVDYAYDELDYIDKEHIGILGHSMVVWLSGQHLCIIRHRKSIKCRLACQWDFLCFQMMKHSR